MRTVQINRDDFQTIVNYCTRVLAHNLQPSEFYALRDVGKKNHKVAYNCWEHDGVPCPATQVWGYFSATDSERAQQFSLHYDAAVHDWLVVDQQIPEGEAEYEWVLEIVD